jgi:hypothetical protein
MPPADSLPASNPNGLRLINPLETPDWDTRLAGCPGVTFFHTAAWARVLHDSYGYQPLYIVSPGTGPLRTLLPLMEIDSWLTGRRGVALPFTDLAEPLCRDADSFHPLFNFAVELARQRDWKYLECRGGRQWLPAAPASTSFLNHSLALGPGEGALFSGCEDSVRRAVRKAERNNLRLDFSQSRESMQAFYDLLCRTRRRHGVPPQPFSFFANIQRHVLASNRGWVVLAWHGAVPVAGAVFLHFGRQAIYKFGASDETHQNLRANNLVMWRAIQHYAQNGYDSLDFGRTSLFNEGLRKFKLGWGALEREVSYVRYDPREGAFVTARDEAQGWHNRVFRLLPLPLSRLAGIVLYRHIA